MTTGKAVAAMCALCTAVLHAGTPFSNVVDRVCEITSVSEVSGKSPYTQVDFTLRPEKGSEILCRMALPPPSRWNGEFWGVGNSSLGGTIPKIAHHAQYGAAVATTDLGTRRYVSGDLKGECLSDIALRDYSWRATHFMTVYGKRIAKSFYGRPHSRAYFAGGSCGGRQAMCEAMRYPEDYDGIIASIPAAPAVANAFQTLHRYLTTHDGEGNALVTPQQLCILADAPIEYMKGKEPEPYDGNFLSCPFSFTPADIEGVIDVAAKRDPALGTSDLRARLREFFLGLSRNGRVLCHGILPGTRQGNPKGGSYRMIGGRYIGRPDNAASPSVEWLERTVAERGGELNASSFDLSAFRDRGGKLFITVGLEDQTTHTPSMIAWYEMMCERMGGLAEVQKFCRLFAMPGVAHGGGEGRVKRPGTTKGLAFPLIRAWVEIGKAPESMPLAIRPGETMPIPPYPLMAYKDGSGAWKTKRYPNGAVRHPDPSLFQTDLEPWKRSGVDKEPPEATAR